MPERPEPGSLHHVEIYVADLERAEGFWGWLLGRLGYAIHRRWEGGVSYRLGDAYLVFCRAPGAHAGVPFDRRRPGLNHLAFHAASRRDVDALTEELRSRGVPILYEDRHPFAGGRDHYAVFFEDPERMKVEIVAREAGDGSRFSARTSWDRGWSPLAVALARRRASGAPILDLTESNPTRCGFAYPAEEILDALSTAGSMAYAPDPRGKKSARIAISSWYGARGRSVDPDHLVLCAGTSEAYSWAFKLLCEPGQQVLVPEPSYPLFEFLARAEGIRLAGYPLAYEGRWTLHPDEVERRIDAATRAVIIVQPNNPTGSFLSRSELDALARIAAAHRMAIVSDEVFSEFVFDGAPGSQPSALDAAGSEGEDCLRFVLGGLSKAAGLPQMKLSWIAVRGPGAERDEALERLEILGDTFLSVNTPVQEGCGRILSAGVGVRDQILERVRRNYASLRRRRGDGDVWDCLAAEGGWYAVLRVPRIRTDEEWARVLLEEDGVSVHPGHLFDFEGEGYLVLSLLPEPAEFEEGVGRILKRIALEI